MNTPARARGSGGCDPYLRGAGRLGKMPRLRKRRFFRVVTIDWERSPMLAPLVMASTATLLQVETCLPVGIFSAPAPASPSRRRPWRSPARRQRAPRRQLQTKAAQASSIAIVVHGDLLIEGRAVVRGHDYGDKVASQAGLLFSQRIEETRAYMESNRHLASAAPHWLSTWRRSPNSDAGAR